MPLTLIAIVAAVVAFVWLRNQAPGQRPQAILKLALLVGIAILVVLAVTGRLHFLFAFLAFLYPLLRRILPSLLGGLLSGSGGGGSRASAGNQSQVSGEILEMSLDHDSGTMRGRVIQGPMEGRELDDLSEQEFLELLRYCREHDDDSARLLETYLDRRFGDSWRADDQSEGGKADEGERPSGSAGGPLTESEALDILGLEPGASRDEIIKAHRRMMQKLHPDHGGSDYLAARINEAKYCLLG